MLKFIVPAIFGICICPSFLSAQDIGSVMTEPTVVAVQAPSVQPEPMVEHAQTINSAPMFESAGGDCGCGAPAVSDCGCGADAGSDCGCMTESCAPRTRKRLALVDVQRQRCRLKMSCTTDCCGCPKRKLTRETISVNRKRLALVDAPARERCGCAGGRLRGMLSKIGSRRCGAASSCGCGAEPMVESCGCGAEPMVESCGCGAEPMVESCGCGAATAAPAVQSSCGCGN